MKCQFSEICTQIKAQNVNKKMFFAFLLRTKQTILSLLSPRGFDRQAFEEQVLNGMQQQLQLTAVEAQKLERLPFSLQTCKSWVRIPLGSVFFLSLLSSKKLIQLCCVGNNKLKQVEIAFKSCLQIKNVHKPESKTPTPNRLNYLQ